MTQIQLRHIPIYKVLIIILGAFVLCESTLSCANAVEYGTVQYSSDAYVDYSKFNPRMVKKIADYYFAQAVKSSNPQEKEELLEKAGREYYILTKIEPNDFYALNQMARVYDYENQNSLAKAYFYKALEINKNHAPTNFYFGEYFYSRNNYRKALYYYNIAFRNGYKENYDVLIKMAEMYEKLGDLLRANQYYKKAFLARKDKVDLAEKIRELEDLQYKNTGYYSKRRKK